MPVEPTPRTDALHSAREGIQRAQERLDRAAQSTSRVSPASLDTQRLERVRADERRSDYINDQLELSRAAQEARINSSVARTSAATSEETVNLGRRIDVRA
ncbi:hypothetical protein JW859_05235 [bacterium]|nr:hypothetical protein [bacterium]